MPFGGVKESGYGKDMSMYALEDYTAVRHVMDWLAGYRLPEPTRLADRLASRRGEVEVVPGLF